VSQPLRRARAIEEARGMTPDLHPLAPHALPAFIARPGEGDTLMVVMAVVLVASILGAGVVYLVLHSLPERMAHGGRKAQFQIVAVLGLLALITHQNLFWVAALLLALVDIPDLSGPVRRIADALERMASRRRAEPPPPPAPDARGPLGQPPVAEG
jgi:hypothetical protein